VRLLGQSSMGSASASNVFHLANQGLCATTRKALFCLRKQGVQVALLLSVCERTDHPDEIAHNHFT
jgi:hypothetical protein